MLPRPPRAEVSPAPGKLPVRLLRAGTLSRLNQSLSGKCLSGRLARAALINIGPGRRAKHAAVFALKCDGLFQ